MTALLGDPRTCVTSGVAMEWGVATFNYWVAPLKIKSLSLSETLGLLNIVLKMVTLQKQGFKI